MIIGEWQAGITNKKAYEEESRSAVETSQIQDIYKTYAQYNY